jgi:hypothetical protein
MGQRFAALARPLSCTRAAEVSELRQDIDVRDAADRYMLDDRHLNKLFKLFDALPPHADNEDMCSLPSFLSAFEHARQTPFLGQLWLRAGLTAADGMPFATFIDVVAAFALMTYNEMVAYARSIYTNLGPQLVTIEDVNRQLKSIRTGVPVYVPRKVFDAIIAMDPNTDGSISAAEFALKQHRFGPHVLWTPLELQYAVRVEVFGVDFWTRTQRLIAERDLADAMLEDNRRRGNGPPGLQRRQSKSMRLTPGGLPNSVPDSRRNSAMPSHAGSLAASRAGSRRQSRSMSLRSPSQAMLQRRGSYQSSQASSPSSRRPSLKDAGNLVISKRRSVNSFLPIGEEGSASDAMQRRGSASGSSGSLSLGSPSPSPPESTGPGDRYKSPPNGSGYASPSGPSLSASRRSSRNSSARPSVQRRRSSMNVNNRKAGSIKRSPSGGGRLSDMQRGDASLPKKPKVAVRSMSNASLVHVGTF